MKTDPPTTVRLSENAQRIKDKLSPVYGLKNILSAGIVLFNKLPQKERESIIIESINSESVAYQNISPAIAYIKKLALTEAGYETDIKVLSRTDAEMLSELRNILGANKKNKRKNTKQT